MFLFPRNCDARRDDASISGAQFIVLAAVLSVLASGEKRGVYRREEVVANAVLLLLAGHETTINLICNGTLAFIRHPDQWALLQRDPALAVRACWLELEEVA